MPEASPRAPLCCEACDREREESDIDEPFTSVEVLLFGYELMEFPEGDDEAFFAARPEARANLDELTKAFVSGQPLPSWVYTAATRRDHSLFHNARVYFDGLRYGQNIRVTESPADHLPSELIESIRRRTPTAFKVYLAEGLDEADQDEEETPRPRGRPVREVPPTVIAEAKRLRSLGATDSEICEKLGIGRRKLRQFLPTARRKPNAQSWRNIEKFRYSRRLREANRRARENMTHPSAPVRQIHPTFTRHFIDPRKRRSVRPRWNLL